jgi:hypothetical protein
VPEMLMIHKGFDDESDKGPDGDAEDEEIDGG